MLSRAKISQILISLNTNHLWNIHLFLLKFPLQISTSPKLIE